MSDLLDTTRWAVTEFADSEATYSRLNATPIVWAVQETTEANWTTLRATEGVGPLGHTACQGLVVHTPLALTPARVPLGLVAQQVWARTPDDIGKRARRKQLPLSQKERQQWLHSLDAVHTARVCCPTPLPAPRRGPGGRCL